MRPALWFAVVFLILVILAVAGGTLFLRGGAHASTFDAVPAEASLVLQSPDPARLARAVARTELAAASPDPDRTMDLLVMGVSAIFGSAGITLPPQAAAWLRESAGETTIALLPGDPGSPPAVLLVSRVARGLPVEAASLRQALTPSVPEGSVWSERRHRAHTYSVLRPGGGPPFCVAVSGNLLVASSSGTSMRRALDTLDGRDRSLARDTSARLSGDRLPRRADLYVHASGDAVRAWLGGLEIVHPWIAHAAQLGGVAALRHAALSVRVRQGMFEEALFLVLAPEGRGLPGALFDGPARAEQRQVPADPRFAARLALSLGDASRAWSVLPTTLLSSRVAPTADGLAERLSGLEAFLEINLGRELFGALGHEARLAWGQAEPLPRLAPGSFWRERWEISLTLRNPEAARRVLRRTDGLARAIGSRREGPVAAERITWYELPALAPFMPAYRLHGRVLHIASTPELLVDQAHGSGDDAPPPPGAERSLPSQAHLQFRLSTRRLADAVLGSRSDNPLTADWQEALRRMGRGSPPLIAGSGRMDGSGFLLRWVSPASAPVLALVALEKSEIPDKDDVTAGEDPLY